ncbi:MAG: ATP-binding protein [Candidatus Nitrosocaldus sp.]
MSSPRINLDKDADTSAEGPLGFVVGEAYPYRFTFIAKRAMSVGEYVVVDTGSRRRILGMVEQSSIRSSIMDGVSNYHAAHEGKAIAERNVRDKSYLAVVRVLGYIDELSKGKVTLPSLPPEPGSVVSEANRDELRVFSLDGSSWTRIGSLLRNSSVGVSVNLDRVASRHLAILSVTGGGKSNLLALIAKRVAELNGTMVIFDYHGEYADIRMSNVEVMDARINPRYIDEAERLAGLLEVREYASVQREVLGKVLTDDVRSSEDFWAALKANIDALKDMEEGKGSKKNMQVIKACDRLQGIIDSAVRRLGPLLDTSMLKPLDMLKPNKVNILNMIEFSEKQANIAIAYYLEEILDDRKRSERMRKGNSYGSDTYTAKFDTPVICAIEEAHVFLPNNRDTDSKYIASKIAREGRKFGVSLIIVSQRPRRLDQDVLSQMGSLAILRLTNPEDQRYINEASEVVSKELLEYLPSLNVGEAILVGQWVNIPSIVKIDEVKEKRAGADIGAVEQWQSSREHSNIARESTEDLMEFD